MDIWVISRFSNCYIKKQCCIYVQILVHMTLSICKYFDLITPKLFANIIKQLAFQPALYKHFYCYMFSLIVIIFVLLVFQIFHIGTCRFFRFKKIAWA